MKPSALRSFAPAIAIVLIFAVYFAAQFWILPARRAAQAPPETDPAPGATPAPEAAPAPATVVGDAAPLSAGAESEWPTFRGGANYPGAVDTDFSTAPPVRWQQLIEGAILQPPVASAESLFVATTKALVVALGLDGTERWRVTLAAEDGATESLQAPLTVFGNALVAPCLSGRIYVLDTASGALRWRAEIGGEILGAANVYAPDDGSAPQLYALERIDGIMHRFDLATGALLGKGEALARCDGAPAIGGGLVVYGSCDFAVHVHDAGSGDLLKNIRLCDDCQVASAPALIENIAYTGTRIGFFYAIDVSTGGIVWTNQDCDQEIFTSPAVGEKRVIFGAEDGSVYALDRATGRLEWRIELDDAPQSPVIAGSTVLLSAGGVLHARALADGAALWTHEISDGISAPAVVAGQIVVGSEDGTIVALGPG